MASALFPITGLAAIGAAIAFGMAQQPAPIHEPVEISASAPQRANTWMIENANGDDVCLITKTQRVSLSTMKIDVDPTCSNLIAGGSDIQVWQEDEQGNVYLGDERGDIIAEFSPAVDEKLSLPIWKQGKLTLTPLL